MAADRTYCQTFGQDHRTSLSSHPPEPDRRMRHSWTPENILKYTNRGDNRDSLMSLRTFSGDYDNSRQVVHGLGSTAEVATIPDEPSTYQYLETPDETQASKQEQGELVKWSTEWNVFADTVAISGVRYAVDSTLPVVRRMLWTAIIVIGSLFMIYQLVERVAYYYSYPMATHVDVLYPRTMDFPAVTICNENVVGKKAAQSLGLENMYKTLYWQYADGDNPGPPVNWTGLDSMYNSTPRHLVDWRDINTRLGYSWDDVVVNCLFHNEPCSPANDAYSFTDMGYCITFNNEGAWRVRRSGSEKGLQLILAVNQHDYLATTSPHAGFRILPHGPNEYPDMLGKGILLSPGVNTNVDIRRSEVTLLGPPYGSCDPTKQLDYVKSYTVDGCYSECRSKYILERCGCVEIAFAGKATSERVCDPREHHTCVFEATVTYYDEQLAEQICQCPPPCNITSYSYSTSQSTLSHIFVDFVASQIVNITNTTDFRSEYLSVSMFYPSLSLTLVSENKAYDIFTLFCDMGGALGLLLGSTFLTLYEFLDFVVFTAWAVHKARQE